MLSLRALAATLALLVGHFNLTTCQSRGDQAAAPAPAEASAEPVDLPGVDTAALTGREKREWSGLVSDLLAPCPDQPVSVAQCVKEARDCQSCAPAARFLANQVKKGKTRSQIESAFRLRFAADQVKSIDIADSPFKGPQDAPVVIVEWADFECPFCGRAAPVLHDTVKKFPGQVKLVFKHYPLAAHPGAEQAARAAVAAGRQGKFWEMHQRLFEQQNKGMDAAALKRIAAELGLDEKRFIADLESEATADVVARDRKQANALDLEGTPMIYINGRHFDLQQFDLQEDLNAWLELELSMQKGAKKPAPAAPKPAAPAGSATPEAAGKAP
ncbi:MAG TPA: thioredoxin domain-containing protein [Polyangiaceae bacterium]|nr:thioredoxin domain-containing protein [Polyangiaceae bacterium]